MLNKKLIFILLSALAIAATILIRPDGPPAIIKEPAATTPSQRQRPEVSRHMSNDYVLFFEEGVMDRNAFVSPDRMSVRISTREFNSPGSVPETSEVSFSTSYRITCLVPTGDADDFFVLGHSIRSGVSILEKWTLNIANGGYIVTPGSGGGGSGGGGNWTVSVAGGGNFLPISQRTAASPTVTRDLIYNSPDRSIEHLSVTGAGYVLCRGFDLQGDAEIFSIDIASGNTSTWYTNDIIPDLENALSSLGYIHYLDELGIGDRAFLGNTFSSDGLTRQFFFITDLASDGTPDSLVHATVPLSGLTQGWEPTKF